MTKAKTASTRTKRAATKPKSVGTGLQSLAVVIKKSEEQEQENVATSNVAPLMSNPMTYIDDLSKLSPFWGGVALRVLTSAIGYYAVNSILWAHRKRNQEPKVTSGIDWLNDSMAEIKEKEANEKNTVEQGHSVLHFVDGIQFIGAYKYLFMQVTASGDETGNFPLPTPAELYNRMTIRQQERADVLAAYDTFQMEQYKNSPNFAYIEARMKADKERNDVRAVKKAQQELDHIHEELRSITMEVFDDNVWMRLPMWAQFKLLRSLHKQTIAAIASENEKPADERIQLHDLDTLGKTVLLELEAADRHPEVRLAFEKNVLKLENHGLLRKAA